ncbi:MAG: hypothetical protein P8P74_14550 [Crocinitomicaceae bacterium]|nr:hypothetical protein [Crocinitomicaceae bacterium]
MKRFLVFSFLFLSAGAFAQDYDVNRAEDRLFTKLEELRSAENNEAKELANKEFKSDLAAVLEHKESFDHPFSLLSTVGFIDSKDKMVRIINWNVEQDDKTQRYYAFVQHFDKRKKELSVTELKEDVWGIKQPDEVVTADQWYGALYYKIIPVKKGSKTIYTVLGWDGNTTLSNIKLIDAMYINGRSVKFGSPIFKVGKETKKRMFYEHSEKVTMTLQYESGRDRIMMDHLSPETPTMKGYYSFYVPDLSYDAFVFEDKKWVLKEDVIGVNNRPRDEKIEVLTKDPKTGKLVKRKIDNTWQDPSNPGAPAGGNEHVAITPETQKKDEESKESNSNEPKVDKRDKRDPSESSIFGDMNKKKKKRRRRKRKN